MLQYLKHICCLLLIGADRLAISAPRKKSGVAIVRLDAIGDFILWTHTAREYRNHYRSQKLVLIANALWADLAAQLPFWDEVWPVDPEKFNKDFFYRWRTMRRISRAGFRVAIQPTYSRIMLKGDSVVRATGAAEKIGYLGDESNMIKGRKAIADTWFTQLFASPFLHLTEFERNIEFVNYLFNTGIVPKMETLPVWSVQKWPWTKKSQTNYFIIFPGASKPLRQWPIENFARIADELHLKYGWQPLICGAPNEHELCQRLKDAINAEAVNIAGKTTLAEFVEIVRGAKLLIGNETSAIHIAAAVNTPSVCITGGGHFGRFVPYPAKAGGQLPVVATHPMECFHCNWQCTRTSDLTCAVPCIEAISVKTVMNCVKQALEENVYVA